MIDTPRWSNDELEVSRQTSIDEFRRERLEEPAADYLRSFDACRFVCERLLEATDDLAAMENHALAILCNDVSLEAFRYLAGPPISLDDLKTLVAAPTLSASQLQNSPQLVHRLVETVLIALDQRRFPWVAEGRASTEEERTRAVMMSAALMATSRSGTARRSAGKTKQEDRVRSALLNGTFREVPTRTVSMLGDAPGAGEFCGESLLGGRKADFIVRLWDGRVLAVECKVSNSATNSVKRLNNDAAAKAEQWRTDFGTRQVVPAAVLSGVYKLPNLIDAQRRGLSLFWAHNLDALLDWIEATRD